MALTNGTQIDDDAPPSGDSLIQLAYAEAVKSFLGIPGDNQSIYVCPVTTQGLAAGSWVPQEVTNGQLYQTGDYLLPTDTPVFVPGVGSYSDILRT